MARLEDLKLSHRLFMNTYRYRSVDWSPGARLVKPLSEARLALISTAGLHLGDQPVFDPAIKGGDASFRELADNVEVQELRIAHRSSAFDQTGALKDRNLVFPLNRFRELVARREVGSLNHRHFTFMGSITAPGRLISESAPQVAAKLQEDQVDAVFLVPV
jgi:D-proline reductase (dithiol) PrdB